MFLKAYNLFSFLGKKLNSILGADYVGPAFVYRVSLESNFKDFTDFFPIQHYDISY